MTGKYECRHGQYESEFRKIEHYHFQKQAKLLSSGKGVQRPTPCGYWAAAHPRSVFELFRQIGLSSFRHFVDLGSGDGMVSAVASLFTCAVGIEADESLHICAEKMKAGLESQGMNLNVSFVCGNFLEHDLSGYDCIFINPDNYFYKLEGKLKREFKGTLVAVNNIFTPLTLVPERTVEVLGVKYDVYVL